MKKTLIISLGIISSLQAMEKECPIFIPIEKESYFSKEENVSLYHGNGKFMVKDEDYKPVQNAFVDKPIRNMDTIKLLNYLKHGYLVVNKLENGDYAVHVSGRMHGGGIIGAQIGFWIGKIGTYAVAGAGTAALATSAAVVTVGTGGTAGAIIGSGAVSGGVGAVIAGVTAVEATSNSVAIGLAIFFGTITGPI